MPDNTVPDVTPLPTPLRLRKRFGDLSPRLKWAIPRNLFFAVLAAAVFWALTPGAGHARYILLLVPASVYGQAALPLEVVVMPL
jgi:hypothetical protein